MFLQQKIKIGFWVLRSFIKFSRQEVKRGTFRKNIPHFLKTNEMNIDMSWAELLEEKAEIHPENPFIMYEGKELTFREMDLNANRVANFLMEKGGTAGKGLALLMDNSPAFLDIFFGTQKIGMYIIPVNTSLRGNSLVYILNHCEAEYLVLDEVYIEEYKKISDQLENIKTVIIHPSGLTRSKKFNSGIISLMEAYQKSPEKPETGYNRDDICLIMYTSGTTGFPKGVVYRYRKTSVKLLTIGSNILLRKDDILYTCLALFHGNALFLTMTQGLSVGAKVVLGKKFSASKFWDDIIKYDITTFNTIGAIIPILMKQPEKPTDNKNKVRFTLSAACPVDSWRPFEKRFGIIIYEGYGSVDGGGKGITNLGTAPVGSIGKPNPGVEYRLVDEDMNDVPDETPGELIFASKGKGKSVEYYRNEKATNEKLMDGWLHTGDLVRRDKKGYLYFVGRNTESMRIKGENVSAYEVEHAILKHPAVLEAAVYAVPSELAEDDIYTSITLVNNKKLREADLVEYLKDNLPRFAVPRYIKIVDKFPKTETQRIRKKELEKLGIVPGTYDASKDTHV